MMGQEKERLQGEVNELAVQLNDEEDRARGLESQIATLNEQWLADRESLTKAQTYGQNESKQRAAAEQTVTEHAATIKQLTQEKRAAEQSGAQLRSDLDSRTEELDGVKRQLTAAQGQARQAEEQVATLTTER